MDPLNAHVWKKFHVHKGDYLPYSPWLYTEPIIRDHIPELFAEFQYKVGAEVGVRSGEFSETICKKVPEVKLYCIDPWSPYGKVSQNRQDRYFRWARHRLAPYNVEFIKKTSVEAALQIPDDSLDFVYIDGLHDFDNVMMDLLTWDKKVKKGGIVSGHDYFNMYMCGVIHAVNAYTQAHGINMWYITRDTIPSWLWVKS